MQQKRVAEGANVPIKVPPCMIQPDADIILAIHSLRSILFTTNCKHVYNQQYTRNMDRKKDKEASKRMSVSCNRET